MRDWVLKEMKLDIDKYSVIQFLGMVKRRNNPNFIQIAELEMIIIAQWDLWGYSEYFLGMTGLI